MTTSNLDSSTVIGKTIYLELYNPTKTAYVQFFLTPAARVPSNPSAVIDPTVYRRQLTVSVPKRQWRSFPIRNSSFSVESAPLSDRLTDHVANYFQRLINANYKLINEPIIVETSLEDAVPIRQLKTPYKLLGRIEKVRKAKGFPQKLF